MAKRDDDEGFDAEEVAETEDVAEADEAEEAEADDAEADDAEADDAEADEAEEAAEPDDAEVADADDDRAGDDGGADDEPARQEKPAPKPKVTGLTLTLCILNMVAALGFIYLLMMNYEKRQGYAFAAVSKEFELVGVGTVEEKQLATSAGIETLPKVKLSNDALKKAFQERGAGSPGGDFMSVEERLTYHFYAGDITPEIMKELMSDLGNPVGSIEEEMRRLKGALPGEIKKAAEEAVRSMEKTTDLQKQQRIGRLLYPLCLDPYQVEKLEAKIQATKASELDKMLEEAVERRILADILLPSEMFRPSDADKLTLERVADLDAVKLDDVRALFDRRFEAAAKETFDGEVHYGKEFDGVKRWTVEKRQNAAFLLISVAFARKHVESAPKEANEMYLDPKGVDKALERAQRISGLFDFTEACSNYNQAVGKLRERVLAAIVLDRDGSQTAINNEVKRSQGFADKFAAVLFRIRQLQIQIRQADERAKDLDDQLARADKLVQERGTHLAEVEKRIVQERAQSAKAMKELRMFQDQLYRALRELATAADDNAGILREIERLSGVKGDEP